MSDRDKIIAAVRGEFQKHRFDTFVDEPPSVAQGGKGVVVPGCAVVSVRHNRRVAWHSKDVG